MKKKILIIFAIILCFVGLTGCNFFNDGSTDITNNVTNNITNNTTEYGPISITDFEQAIETAAKKVEDSVIGITLKQVMKTTIGFNSVTYEQAVGIGSGVIYKRVEVTDDEGNLVNYDYYVITNRHVIEGDSKTAEYKVYAYLGYDDMEIAATLISYDNKVDLACVKFSFYRYIVPAEFADSDSLEKGSFAIAVGNPEGYEFYGSVTFGVISSNTRYLSTDTDNDGITDFYSEYIQHDVAINPGNSGGGLFNIKGELIGINTLKLASSEIDNMGFSIPSNIVKKLIEEYLEPGIEIKRPRLGINVIEVRNLNPVVISENNLKDVPSSLYGSQTPWGLYVTSVSSGSTIANSSIVKDDIILKFGGVKITQMYILSSKLNSLLEYQIGSQVEIEYYSRSSNSIKTTTVVLKG